LYSSFLNGWTTISAAGDARGDSIEDCGVMGGVYRDSDGHRCTIIHSWRICGVVVFISGVAGGVFGAAVCGVGRTGRAMLCGGNLENNSLKEDLSAFRMNGCYS